MSSSFYRWLIASVVLACVVGGLLVFAFQRSRPRPANMAEKNDKATSAPVDKPVEKRAAKPQAAIPADTTNLIDDDGRTLWVSPTSGPPLDLSYLPPGSQFIVALRPAALAGNAEGMKVLAAFGPLGQRGIRYLENATRMRLSDVEALVISCQATSGGDWLVALVARVTTPMTADSLLTKLSGATADNHVGKRYWLAGGRAYYLPEEREGRVLVVVPPTLVDEIIDLAGAVPPLRRDVERLLTHTDADRRLTLILAPTFLFSEGQGMFSGGLARLRGPLLRFLGDGLSAVAVSMNWDENFFVELIAVPTLDVSAEKAAGQLAESVRQLPDLVEDYVVRLNPRPYGRRVIARFPAMVRKLAAYTRSGVESDCAVLRCYLPAVAGHNLIMGAELTLAEAPEAGGETASNVPVAEATSPAAKSQSVRELLARKTSLKFSRDSLEAALEQLSQDVGVEIVIVGPDLQADGITRNQQLAMDMADQPAEDILVEILRRANPDKSASGPADRRQKLVYVVKPKSASGPEAVFVTTRARAAERGDTLPAAFRP